MPLLNGGPQIDQARDNPADAAARRAAQMAFVRSNYVWDVRAQQWIALVQQMASKNGLHGRIKSSWIGIMDGGRH